MLAVMMEQVCGAAGGQCGPIEALVLATSVRQAAYSRYWMDAVAGMEDPTSPAALKLLETASRIADASRQNSLAAYDLAVRVARNKPVTPGDPLAAYMDAPRPDDDE